MFQIIDISIIVAFVHEEMTKVNYKIWKNYSDSSHTYTIQTEGNNTLPIYRLGTEALGHLFPIKAIFEA